MRVRTYGFPGCFTRPPGTSTRNHPHEPTTSKPVVPGDVLHFECIGYWKCGENETDAVPSHFEEPAPVRPEGPSWRVARPHTSVASLFAARFRVWIQRNQGDRRLQPRRGIDPAHSRKNPFRARRGATEPSADGLSGACARRNRSCGQLGDA